MSGVKKNWLEWSVFAVGLVLISVLIGYLVYDAVTLGNDPPVINVELGTVEMQDSRYLVPVTLRNLGDETAAEVAVEVLLMNGDQEVEAAEFTTDFLPRRSTRKGWVTFQTDPATVETIETHVLGYRIP